MKGRVSTYSMRPGWHAGSLPTMHQIGKGTGKNVREAGGKMTSDDKGYIYPYEYWDKSLDLGDADENGWRYMEYCRRLGRKPKFSGKYKGEKWTDEGDFIESKGYWKTLIDRRMYGRDGKFQEMTPIDSNGFDTELMDIKAMRERYNETRVADDEGVNTIVKNVRAKEEARTGEYEYPYGMGQAEGAECVRYRGQIRQRPPHVAGGDEG